MSNLYDYEKKDGSFIGDLEKSKVAVDKAARFLSNKGIPVIIQPTHTRADVRDRNAYADDGDLKILLTVEVKHRPTLFFSKGRGFKYATVIIDACHIFDRHKIKPIYYIIWNSDYTSLIFINVNDTFAQWIKTKKFDNAKGRERKFYEVDIKLCVIVDVRE